MHATVNGSASSSVTARRAAAISCGMIRMGLSRLASIEDVVPKWIRYASTRPPASPSGLSQAARLHACSTWLPLTTRYARLRGCETAGRNPLDTGPLIQG